jgi:hypothetical protein
MKEGAFDRIVRALHHGLQQRGEPIPGGHTKPPSVGPLQPSAPDVAGPSAEAHRRYYQDCVTRWSADRYALDNRFVHLTLLLDQGETAQGPRWQVSERFQELSDVLTRVPNQALVLLGPPGCGKSTLLRHFELENARAVLDGRVGETLVKAPLTFFIPLNDYKARGSDEPVPLPVDWLVQRWAAAYPELLPLDTLLLDALNEMPHAGREAIRLWKDFLRTLDRDYPGNRVIFSCRSLDYSASLSSDELPVPQVRIEPLSDAQVQQFVEFYCPEHATALWANLDGSPQLDLLRSPYYLKLLVEQTVTGEIPTGRAALFTGFVRGATGSRPLGAGAARTRPAC